MWSTIGAASRRTSSALKPLLQTVGSLAIALSLSACFGSTTQFSTSSHYSSYVDDGAGSPDPSWTPPVDSNPPSPVTPNDTYFAADLWGLNNTGQFSGTTGADISATLAWAAGTSCSGVLIGVIDSGVDFTHTDLTSNLAPNFGSDQGTAHSNKGWDFVNNDNDPTDDNVHGTHVTGTIAARGNNSAGVTGICWRAKILPIKVADDQGSIAISDAISGINWAVGQGAYVLNNSWGFTPPDSSYANEVELLRESVAAARDAGVLFVAAAGNGDDNGNGINNDNIPTYPASYALSNMIAVAASTNQDALTQWSNYGSNTVHIAAPGEWIVSTTPLSTTAQMTTESIVTQYDFLSGTSMATPHVTAAAAMIWTQNPTLTMAQVKNRILSGADKITGITTQDSRRLNLRGMQLITP